jgi:hypothetical protein
MQLVLLCIIQECHIDEKISNAMTLVSAIHGKSYLFYLDVILFENWTCCAKFVYT